METVSDDEPIIVMTRKQVKDMMLVLLRDHRVKEIIDESMSYVSDQLHAYAIALGIFTVATYQTLALSKDLGNESFEKGLRTSKIMAEIFKENVDRLLKYVHEAVEEGSNVTFDFKGGRM